MASGETRNDFLLDLLSLQQDGKRAISAPTNWTTQGPLLEVSTDIDEVIDELQETILVGEEPNDTARWHFFIGSPGNGKSAAMGKLCRLLMTAKGCQVLDERGIPIAELEPSVIPYAINVYEGDNRYSSALIVQDASVVRNPFSSDIDPARELLETLRYAWEKGISLVVCTNRGVLEKACGDSLNLESSSASWVGILKEVVSGTVSVSGRLQEIRQFDQKKTVFKRVSVSYHYLDNRSLLIGRNAFDELIKKASDDTHWEECSICSVREMCPFAANRDWLADEEARCEVLRLLTRAEILSGQVIVFREALAILSLVLGGCPRDYNDIHPCDWVRSRVASGDVFSLAARRVYMSLFASYCPFGLEATRTQRKRQLDALRDLCKDVAESGSEALAAVRKVLQLHSPSTDVGVTRLLGEAGIIASLDPCREPLPLNFYERWDSDFDAIPIIAPYFTRIEQACISIWKSLEESLELASNCSVSSAHWALRRWSSNFLLHLGALVDGHSAWAKELDEFASLLVLVSKRPEDRSPNDKRAIREVDSKLETLLGSATNPKGSASIRIAEGVTLSGHWVREKLRPKTVPNDASGSVTLAVQFSGAERAIFAASMYIWLRRVERGLDSRCLPRELLAGVADARVRAAAKSKYAFEDNDVELVVNTGCGETFRLVRLDGDVDLVHERDAV